MLEQTAKCFPSESWWKICRLRNGLVQRLVASISLPGTLQPAGIPVLPELVVQACFAILE